MSLYEWYARHKQANSLGVGDRVKLTRTQWEGAIGTVITVSGNDIQVRFDKPLSGTSSGLDYWLSRTMLGPAGEQLQLFEASHGYQVGDIVRSKHYPVFTAVMIQATNFPEKAIKIRLLSPPDRAGEIYTVLTSGWVPHAQQLTLFEDKPEPRKL